MPWPPLGGGSVINGSYPSPPGPRPPGARSGVSRSPRNDSGSRPLPRGSRRLIGAHATRRRVGMWRERFGSEIGVRDLSLDREAPLIFVRVGHDAGTAGLPGCFRPEFEPDGEERIISTHCGRRPSTGSGQRPRAVGVRQPVRSGPEHSRTKPMTGRKAGSTSARLQSAVSQTSPSSRSRGGRFRPTNARRLRRQAGGRAAYSDSLSP